MRSVVEVGTSGDCRTVSRLLLGGLETRGKTDSSRCDAKDGRAEWHTEGALVCTNQNGHLDPVTNGLDHALRRRGCLDVSCLMEWYSIPKSHR